MNGSDPSSAAAPASPRFSIRLRQAFRRYFVTGLATLFPVAVTAILIWKIFQIVDGFLGRLLGFSIFGLGLIVTGLIILVVGVLSVHFFGRVLFRTIEGWFSRLPVIRQIYPAVKQIASFFFTEEGQPTGFRRVVLVQFPRSGSYSLAFVTNESQTAVTGQACKLLTLLIPTPPSPLTGPVIFVPEHEVVPLTLSVEDAIKLIVSGGVVGAPIEAASSLSRQRVG